MSYTNKRALYRALGKRSVLSGFIVISGLLLNGCSSKSTDFDFASQTKEPVVSLPNEEYNLVVEFYGEHLQADSSASKALFIDRIFG